MRNYEPKYMRILAICLAIAILLVTMLTSSCYNQRKATQQFSKAAVAYPKIGADYCADNFSVTAKTDSTYYKESLKTIDSLSSVLLNNDLLSQDERASLITEIERVRGLIIEPKNCDSLSNAIYKLANKEKQRGDKLQDAYNNLIAASHKLKPIHDTVINQAPLKSCQLNNSLITDLLKKQTDKADKYKAQSGKRGLYMWSLLALVIVYCGWKVYGIFKPKIK